MWYDLLGIIGHCTSDLLRVFLSDFLSEFVVKQVGIQSSPLVSQHGCSGHLGSTERCVGCQHCFILSFTVFYRLTINHYSVYHILINVVATVVHLRRSSLSMLPH